MWPDLRESSLGFPKPSKPYGPSAETRKQGPKKSACPGRTRSISLESFSPVNGFPPSPPTASCFKTGSPYGKSLTRSLLHRACAKITSHSRISSSGHLRPTFNREILKIALLILRFLSFRSTKSALNLNAIKAKLFLRKPLVHWARRRFLGRKRSSQWG